MKSQKSHSAWGREVGEEDFWTGFWKVSRRLIGRDERGHSKKRGHNWGQGFRNFSTLPNALPNHLRGILHSIKVYICLSIGKWFSLTQSRIYVPGEHILNPGRPLPVCEAQVHVKDLRVTGKESETRNSFLG